MTEFYIKVEPGCSEFKLERGTYPVLHLTEEAENGRANSELLEKLEEILGSRPGIVSGRNSSRKKIAVKAPREEIERKLGVELVG